MRILLSCLLVGACAQPTEHQSEPASDGHYRLPYADGVWVSVFDDFETHGPPGRLDFTAGDGNPPYFVAAAAPGRVVAIEDRYGEQQSGRPAAECQNNYVWIAHDNGEWSGYSHMGKHSVRDAGVRVGDRVVTGEPIGIEGTVGCSMLDHVHFEVAVPNSDNPLDDRGFLLDNEGGARLRNPVFCGVPAGRAKKNETYIAAPCPER